MTRTGLASSYYINVRTRTGHIEYDYLLQIFIFGYFENFIMDYKVFTTLIFI